VTIIAAYLSSFSSSHKRCFQLEEVVVVPVVIEQGKFNNVQWDEFSQKAPSDLGSAHGVLQRRQTAVYRAGRTVLRYGTEHWKVVENDDPDRAPEFVPVKDEE